MNVSPLLLRYDRPTDQRANPPPTNYNNAPGGNKSFTFFTHKFTRGAQNYESNVKLTLGRRGRER